MNTKTTILGIVIVALGCTAALAATPSNASGEAAKASVAPTHEASAPVSVGDRLLVELARAAIGVSVLPAGR